MYRREHSLVARRCKARPHAAPQGLNTRKAPHFNVCVAEDAPDEVVALDRERIEHAASAKLRVYTHDLTREDGIPPLAEVDLCGSTREHRVPIVEAATIVLTGGQPDVLRIEQSQRRMGDEPMVLDASVHDALVFAAAAQRRLSGRDGVKALPKAK